ncbi:MAG: ATP-binding protein [Lachnospira sp.]|nr:ATP-binding protein [Lachnospira sp.]
MEKLNRKTYYKPDENIIKKMRDTFYNCPTAVSYCRNLKIPQEVLDENIGILYDFARDVNYCKKCPGIDNCIKENQLLVTKVVYEDGILERQLTPCKKLLEKMNLKNQFMVMDFDPDWLNKDIKNMDQSAGRNLALKKFLAFCKHKSEEWIYLTGEQNTGRSFVAANFAIELAKKEIGPIAFINCPQRFRQLADMNFKNQELFQKTLESYSSVPILILDDFGNEYKNDFIRDTVFEILSKRASNKLMTFFTSDLTIEDIVTLYSTSKAAGVRARQIGRLLKGNCAEEINLGEISIY